MSSEFKINLPSRLSDAMSFGFSQGINNQRLNFFTMLIMTSLSTVLFTIPLLLSSLIFKYFDKTIETLELDPESAAKAIVDALKERHLI